MNKTLAEIFLTILLAVVFGTMARYFGCDVVIIAMLIFIYVKLVLGGVYDERD